MMDVTKAITAGDSQAGRLHWLEFLAMNNPVRRFFQEHLEFRLFKEMLTRQGIDLAGRVILDAGCGSGYSTELLLRDLKPSKVMAFDLMPEQIALARKRGLGVDFFVGDMTRLEAPDESCEAVFVFGVLHHIPDWLGAVGELARVLTVGGVLLVEEPRHGFNFRQFEAGLKSAGLAILERRALVPWYFYSYMCRKEVGRSGREE
jgi:ubiquinone/menaquinone biosynthesis C-methylase UbiE